MAQRVKRLPARQETSVRSLGREDPLEKEIHGCVEVGVSDNGQDDEKVPNEGDQVHEQEEPKEERLQ